MNRGTIGLLAAIVALAVASPAQAASGTWERAWGTNVDAVAPGTGFEVCSVAANCQVADISVTGDGGELVDPAGIAVDAAGNVYVADFAHNAVQKFDSSGNFLLEWGKNVDSTTAFTGFERCTVAANCKAGEPGGLGGEMSGPTGIAADSAGVYVTETGNNRVQRFTSAGNFVLAWGKDVASAGSGNTGSGFEICHAGDTCKAAAASTGLIGEMKTPMGIAANPVGDVYVSEFNDNRVQEFASDGIPIRAWGHDVVSSGPDNGSGSFEVCKAGIDVCKAGLTIGGAAGELSGPTGLAIDGTAIYVVDTNNFRVGRYSLTGAFQIAWGKDVVTSVGGGTGAEICHEEQDVCKPGTSGALGGEFNFPTSIAADTSGVYVGDDDNTSISKFGPDGTFQRTWGEDVDAVAPATGFEICTVAANCQGGGFSGTALGGEVNCPEGLAANPAGALFVSDRCTDRVEKFADQPVIAAPPGPTPNAPAPKKKCKKKKHRAATAKKCKKKKK
jgi:NHL repeat